MKLPEIQTRNKIRDAKICSMFLSMQHEKQEIATKFNITVRTVDRILYKNASVLKKALELTKDQEKVNKILWLKKQIKLSRKFDIDSELTPLTLMDELNKELDENRVSPREETKIIIIRSQENGNQAITISRPVSVLE